jgi:hypothetical protein
MQKNELQRPFCSTRGTRKRTYTTFHWIKQYKIFRIENRENEGELRYNRNAYKNHPCAGDGTRNTLPAPARIIRIQYGNSMKIRPGVLLYERCPGRLKGSPILFSRDVIAGANKAEHICNLPYFVKFGLVFVLYRG